MGAVYTCHMGIQLLLSIYKPQLPCSVVWGCGAWDGGAHRSGCDFQACRLKACRNEVMGAWCGGLWASGSTARAQVSGLCRLYGKARHGSDV